MDRDLDKNINKGQSAALQPLKIGGQDKNLAITKSFIHMAYAKEMLSNFERTLNYYCSPLLRESPDKSNFDNAPSYVVLRMAFMLKLLGKNYNKQTIDSLYYALTSDGPKAESLRKQLRQKLFNRIDSTLSQTDEELEKSRVFRPGFEVKVEDPGGYIQDWEVYKQDEKTGMVTLLYYSDSYSLKTTISQSKLRRSNPEFFEYTPSSIELECHDIIHSQLNILAKTAQEYEL